ncbi:unnamed protein product [Linum tenue]|uniref:ADP-ribosyl cyclase/cyclic ADP-ribose hydrolase n=3 Tax=Linum tenue TaxID=586396 RepID=A0AAV0L5R6_9ROSI|nr:unnamed protein product [Linum tenue]
MVSLVLILLLALVAVRPANGFRRSVHTAAATTDPRPPPWRHHVFLSHRGPDGRHTFTDHLDSALRRKRINVFRDDHDLPRGENVTEAISRAIEESMLSIVVLSGGYASSEYCLDELVKIMNCRKENGHRVFPVFYKVSPDEDVADPSSSGVYKADLDRHKRRHSYERVASWIHALRSISQISGWVIHDHT